MSDDEPVDELAAVKRERLELIGKLLALQGVVNQVVAERDEYRRKHAKATKGMDIIACERDNAILALITQGQELKALRDAEAARQSGVRAAGEREPGCECSWNVCNQVDKFWCKLHGRGRDTGPLATRGPLADTFQVHLSRRDVENIIGWDECGFDSWQGPSNADLIRRLYALLGEAVPSHRIDLRGP